MIKKLTNRSKIAMEKSKNKRVQIFLEEIMMFDPEKFEIFTSNCFFKLPKDE